MLRRRRRCGKDEKKAKELYREAFIKFKPLAEKEEHPFIQYCLGRCYVEGNGTRKNHKKAVEWFQKSVDNGGRPFALFDLGLCYLHGLGVEKDEKKAVDLITQASDEGYDKAQALLASYYYMGFYGVEQDIDKAAELYYKAKDDKALTLIAAQFQLKQDYDRAVDFNTKAANFGNKDSMAWLVNYYKNKGNDLEQADYWEKKAEEK